MSTIFKVAVNKQLLRHLLKVQNPCQSIRLTDISIMVYSPILYTMRY